MTSPPDWWKATFALMLPLWGLLAFAWGLALLLMFTALTAPGRAMGVGFSMAIPGMLLVMLAPALRASRRAATLGGLLQLPLLACVGFAWTQTPDGDSPHSVWLGERPYRRAALANLVPEVDQFTLGSYIAVIDPYVDGPQSDRIRSLFQGIYLEMRQDPEWLAAGSSMNYAYREMAGMDFHSGHLYVVIPEVSEPAGDPVPVVVFLHGSLGNFKGYGWVLQDLSERCGVAVVGPDFGLGNWPLYDQTSTIQQTLDWIEAHPRLEGKPHLMGLSNGGYGVTRAAIAMPEQWHSITYISPVIEPSRMAEVAQAELPIAIISGETDRRTTEPLVRAAEAELLAADAEVWVDIVPGEDHFLFFSQPERVVEGLAAQVCP